MLNGLDLFSGIGGISLALKAWVRTVAYCERDRYAQAVLLSRMRDGLLERAPIWDDVSTLRSGLLTVPIDIIFGGFPCQDISVAGDGVGLGGSRSGLFFEIVRLARELRPRFIFLENVPAITIRGLDRVLLELTALGYDCRWTVVSAAEMGAPHLRERIWILAHANGHALRLKSEPERRSGGADQPESDGEPRNVAAANIDQSGLPNERWKNQPSNAIGGGKSRSFGMANSACIGRGQGRSEPKSKRSAFAGIQSSELADSGCAGLEGWLDTETAWRALTLGGGGGGGGWPSGVPQPAIRRGADGLFRRVDRLRGCGNAVVPIQAREAFARLLGEK